MVYRWLKKLHYHLVPPLCLLCGAAGTAERDLCAGCANELPRNEHACCRCAVPLLPPATICLECRYHPPSFVRAYAPFLYLSPVDFLLKGLKFHGRLSHARLLGELLADALAMQPGPLPQALIPVPLHPARLRERGFNQALELARPVARQLGVPLLDYGRRIRRTPPQMGLDAAARRTNLRGAFQASGPLPVQHVAVLDDVLTTGSTLREFTAVLAAAGAETIVVWALARTVPAQPGGQPI